MRHEESNLQQECVAWFRSEYPQYAMLLTHVPNEGNGNRITGSIRKAEDVVPGVPDLLLFMPANFSTDEITQMYYLLGLEFKTKKGNQSQVQKDFQKIFEAAGYMYVIIRSKEQFKEVINNYIAHVAPVRRQSIASAHVEIVQAKERKEKAHFYKVIGKPMPEE